MSSRTQRSADPRHRSLRDHFAAHPRAARLAQSAVRAIVGVGPSTQRVTRSQVAFRRKRAFAWLWAPEQYLGTRGAPLAISLALPHRLRSRRWKEVVEPRPGWFMHHLEVQRATDIDPEVHRWIRAAWEAAE